MLRSQYLWRPQILWNDVDPQLIARLYGFSLNGLEGEKAKLVLKSKKASRFSFKYIRPMIESVCVRPSE